MDETILDDVVTLNQAAKSVRIRWSTLKDYVIDNGLAIDWPGGSIKVKLSELRNSLIKRRKDSSVQRRRRRKLATLPAMPPNPDVKF
jgi:hypothetical protein